MRGVSELHVQAADRKAGMTQEEILRAVSDAAHAGFTEMGRTEVGFGGQIQSMKFKRPGGEKKDGEQA